MDLLEGKSEVNEISVSTSPVHFGVFHLTKKRFGAACTGPRQVVRCASVTEWLVDVSGCALEGLRWALKMR